MGSHSTRVTRTGAPRHAPKIDAAHLRGLRNVAAIEIAKGVVVMLAALALASMLHRELDFQDIAQSILDFLHIDPDKRLATIFLNAAGRITDLRVVTVLVTASAYSALRFLEGFGLWFGRLWAEWLALASGTIYLPFEIHAIVRKPTPLHWSFLITNLIILAYIAYLRLDANRRRRAAEQR